MTLSFICWWDMLLAEALAQFFCYSKTLSRVWGPFTDERRVWSKRRPALNSRQMKL